MKYIKPLSYSLVIIIISTFILTLLNYIGLVSGLSLKILKIIIPMIAFLYNGYLVGIGSDKKGWLSGLISGIILFVVLILLGLLFKVSISFKTFIYYIVLIILSIIGSMIGINKKH